MLFLIVALFDLVFISQKAAALLASNPVHIVKVAKVAPKNIFGDDEDPMFVKVIKKTTVWMDSVMMDEQCEDESNQYNKYLFYFLFILNY